MATKIRMTYLNLSQGYSNKAFPMEGSATFKMEDGRNSSDLKIALSERQVQVVIEACAESIKEAAKMQAQAFLDDAAAIGSNLLEHRE